MTIVDEIAQGAVAQGLLEKDEHTYWCVNYEHAKYLAMGYRDVTRPNGNGIQYAELILMAAKNK
jgi:hypothetical protein